MPKRLNTGELTVFLATPDRIPGELVKVNEAQAVEYQRDPDGFAARYYGITLEQYYEWNELQGIPLCAGYTKKGKPCNASCRPILPNGMYPSRSAADWLAFHRVGFCAAHGGSKHNFRQRADKWNQKTTH